MASRMWTFGLLAVAFAVGCGDEDDKVDTADTDTDVVDDTDTDTDDTNDTDTDTDTDTDPPTDLPEPVVVPLSAAGPDAFYMVSFGDDGSFFAAGYAAATTDAGADRSMVVAKFAADGTLDTSFGTAGVVEVNVIAAGAGESARGVAVQSTGKILLAGTIEHDAAATGLAADDRDIAVVRLLPDGTLDSSFGSGGVVVLDLGTGLEVMDVGGNPDWVGADTFWSLGVDGNDRILLHGATRGEGTAIGGGPRVDTDFAVVRLTADGALDTSFAGDGVFTLDIEEADASPRNMTVLADGSVIGGGYARTPSFGTVQPVVYKVTPAGVLDAGFADGGVFHDEVWAALAEVYAVAVQGDKLVTAGYGRQTEADSVDWLSLRFTADGERDDTWGTDGVVRVDGAGMSDNARHLTTLPDDTVLIVGRSQDASGAGDAAIGLIGVDGEILAAPITFDLGGTGDMFWGVAVSPDQSKAVAVGLMGADSAMVGPTHNDDAAILVLPLD